MKIQITVPSNHMKLRKKLLNRIHTWKSSAAI